MKTILAVLGILFVVGGTFSGLLNWYLVEFYLIEVDWDGPMVLVNKVTWLFNILGLGLGGMFIGFASMMRSTEKVQY
ncbi:MAG: hypothetical protein ACI9HK_003328 [Pirellulaceae bacterium]|jgi:hypothetical protein